MNALDFIESPEKGLGITLYPIHRTLTKIIFGIPLDYKPQKIQIWDSTHETLLHTVDEPDYLKICYEEGRCNFPHKDYLPAAGFNEAHLFEGRRAGKTTYLSCLQAYMVYRTYELGDPHKVFRIVNGSPIDFSTFCLDKSGAERFISQMRGHIQHGTWTTFMQPSWVYSGSGIRLRTAREKDLKETLGSLTIGAYPANTNCCRGPASICLIYDEFAHFKQADNLYYASMPCTSNYHHEDAMGQECSDALIVSASSPWYNNGKAYELHDYAMGAVERGGSCNVFTHNETTANMAPHISGAFLREQKKKNPLTFDIEFGGKFIYQPKNGMRDSHEPLQAMTYKEIKQVELNAEEWERKRKRETVRWVGDFEGNESERL